MLKKTITYTDFNGDSLTEDFYFNLTKAELIEMELGYEGGLSKAMEKIVASKNGKQIMDTFKSIIRQAYGVRSDDGKRFMKNPELFEQFTQTEAYSEFFMELVTNADEASKFINGLMPEGVNIPQGADLSTPEGIRKASEAQMQGYQKPKVKHDWKAENNG